MSGSKLELKLIPVSKKLSKKGGCRGHIVGRREMDYDEVIDEAIRTSHLNFDSIAMKLVVESVFHSMICGIMKDGVSRRLGDYFTLQLEVKGGFDEPGDQFDPQRHKLAMAVRPLKEFRRVAGDKDVTVYNRNAGPKVVIAKTYSIEINMDKLDPAKNPPLAVMFGLRTRGGEETAKTQLHRARAYFDTWLAKYPEYRGDFSRVVRGDI